MNNLKGRKPYSVRTKNLFNPASSEPFSMSRTKIEDFLACPRCFYMDRRLGVAKPETPSFQLNKAVDELLKREFDQYRKKGEPHPWMKERNIDAVPFLHPSLDLWRDPFKGLQYHHHETHFLVSGAIDDVWQERDGKLIVLDYKATWSEREASLADEYKQSWKRQLEIYQWLFRRNNFEVSTTGYFIFCNVDTTSQQFNKRLEFKMDLWPYEGNDSWIEPKLLAARACLASDQIPDPAPTCDYCAYRKASAILVQRIKSPLPKVTG